MSPVAAIVFWWFFFGATHTLFSSRSLRPRLVATLGTGPFLGVYSLVSVLTFVPLVRAYLSSVHSGVLLLPLASVPGLHTIAMLVAWASFATAIGGLFQPSALSMAGGEVVEARGLGRITRHPLFMSLAVWSLAHLLVNGFATDVAFFGGFVAYSVLGCAHQDARKREAEGSRLSRYFAETSLVPFVAIASGRNRLVVAELPWLGLAVGAALSTVIYLLHPWMFGS
jgi:uncharacterized membrane protein